jgi:3-methyladenine DNA glycosylase AlkD
MNGVTSEAMKRLGYKVNYGVSLTKIKEIAGHFPKSHALAQRLWVTGSRETMILATLLQPEKSFPEEIASEWISQCNNIELTEQCCRNLFVRLPYANSLSVSMLKKTDKYEKAIGYILYSLLLVQDKADEKLFFTLLESASGDIYSDSYTVYSSVARFLKQAGRKNREAVLDFLSDISLNKNGTKWVHEEVLCFLEDV